MVALLALFQSLTVLEYQLSTPKKNSIIWDKSLSHYRIFGSCSPATFQQKLGQVQVGDDSRLRSSAAVFVDILRATTTLVAVGASGCKGIVVDKKPKKGDYKFVAPFFKNEKWVFGGELNGSPIVGIDSSGKELRGVIDNSPLTVKAPTFENKYLRFFSTNGAAAFDALSGAKFNSIFALSLANIEATAQALLAGGPDRIWLVGGGFYGGATIEDSVAAGILIKRLMQLGLATRKELDDEAETMRTHALYFQDGKEILEAELLTRLKSGQVSKLLTGLGHERDVIACINGTGMKATWSEMKSIALVCRDVKKRLLIPEKQDLSKI